MLNKYSNPDRLPCGLIVTDSKLKILFVNSWVTIESGFSNYELLESPLSMIIRNSTHDADFFSGNLMQTNLLKKDGTAEAVFISSKPEELSEQSIIYMVIIKPPAANQKNIRNTYKNADSFHGITGKSPQMVELFGLIDMAASTDSNVVILGESGTGKELAASAIHESSMRKGKPFVRVNCAALTETLLESELFGHVKGAFTGAYKDHTGKFEFADKGTILLDEIGEISQAMQAKLLRVLQERIIVRVGDNKEIHVDVRIIAATNKNLRLLVSKGKFREDLFYRLNVFPIHIPPLRERRQDIALLIQHFIDKFRAATGRSIQSCSTDAMRILMEYCWPGNVRELENTIEHAFVLCRGNEIQVTDLPHELRQAAVRNGICAEKMAGFEQIYHTQPVLLNNGNQKLQISAEKIEQVILRNNGNKTAAARELGISKVGLWKKMKKLGMKP